MRFCFVFSRYFLKTSTTNVAQIFISLFIICKLLNVCLARKWSLIDGLQTNSILFKSIYRVKHIKTLLKCIIFVVRLKTRTSLKIVITLLFMVYLLVVNHSESCFNFLANKFPTNSLVENGLFPKLCKSKKPGTFLWHIYICS